MFEHFEQILAISGNHVAMLWALSLSVCAMLYSCNSGRAEEIWRIDMGKINIYLLIRIACAIVATTSTMLAFAWKLAQ